MSKYDLLRDSKGLEAFKEALSFYIKPGMKILELGSSGGLLSFLAAKLGAEVDCVENDPVYLSTLLDFLRLNDCTEVNVIEADPEAFVPDEKVDVVICEKLHAALLEEKQIQVISSFKRNYLEKFGEASLPLFVPEATLLAIQPVQYSFDFYGFKAPVPMFFDPYNPQTGLVELGDPVLYSSFEYRKTLPLDFSWSGNLAVKVDGTFSALRIITKNLVGIFVESKTSADWHNEYLVIPVPNEKKVKTGDIVRLSFSYQAGGSLESFVESVSL